ncbi:MAG: hypothetical protein Q4Q04_02840 [Methanocorpusculum sp.]|nr:hypothetical protein [Methanocorpusculum sp.]
MTSNTAIARRSILFLAPVCLVPALVQAQVFFVSKQPDFTIYNFISAFLCMVFLSLLSFGAVQYAGHARPVSPLPFTLLAAGSLLTLAASLYLALSAAISGSQSGISFIPLVTIVFFLLVYLPLLIPICMQVPHSGSFQKIPAAAPGILLAVTYLTIIYSVVRSIGLGWEARMAGIEPAWYVSSSVQNAAILLCVILCVVLGGVLVYLAAHHLELYGDDPAANVRGRVFSLSPAALALVLAVSSPLMAAPGVYW